MTVTTEGEAAPAVVMRPKTNDTTAQVLADDTKRISRLGTFINMEETAA